MTNSEFFRANAPAHSVAKEHVVTLSVKRSKESIMNDTANSFNTSVYATPFLLEVDTSNKYKVDSTIVKTT